MKQPYIKSESAKQRKQRLRRGRRKRKAERRLARQHMLTLYFDGSITENPGGRATYGWVLRRGSKTLEEGSGVVMDGKGATNNVAEYVALIMGLEAASKHDEKVKVCGDAKIVINALKYRRIPKGYSPHLQKLYRDAVAWVDKMTVSFEWIPREKNTDADGLSKRATGYPIYQYEDLYNDQPELL